MKLGSKPDLFQTDGTNVWYVANDLASDITVNIGEVKFHLHKFPLLSKSACLQKLVATIEKNRNEVDIHDIPGGPTAFEICAKFCYGMIVTLNAYNVIAARCAAEYLGMHETIEKGNLIYKIEVFLNSSIFCTWKDSIIVLQTTRCLSPFSEELKIVSRCIKSIASRASVDTSKVEWSYTYSQKKFPEQNGHNQNYNGIVSRPTVPMDWWVEDLCELEIDFFKQVIMAIHSKGRVTNEAIGQALKAFAYKRLPGFSKGMPEADLVKCQLTVDTIVWLLPATKGNVSCHFLLKLLKAAFLVDTKESTQRELIRRIGRKLEQASVNDLLIPVTKGETICYDVHIVQKLIAEFRMQDQNSEIESPMDGELQEIGKPSDASKLIVARLIDGYLAGIAKDPNLPLSKFIDLAEMVSDFPRPTHDGLYQAIDLFLKEHPGISKGERKRICRLMDCKKLSADASMHAVQNERLPLRVVVQVLFFEQVKAAASSGGSTPELPKAIMDLSSNGSNESSKPVMTNTEVDWDVMATGEELNALKGELASMRLGSKRFDKVAATGKMKRMLTSKRILSGIWSGKGSQCDHNGSDSSGSLGSTNQEEAKSTPSGDRRHSVS